MTPKKILIVSWLCMAAMILAACAPAAAPTAAPTAQLPGGASSNTMMPAGPAMLQVGSNATLGQFLTDDHNQTLYVLLTDTPNTSTCTGACEKNWPPLLTAGMPAGSGLDATLFGTTTRADGSVQVTFNQHPLYHFAADANPGDTKGQGVGNKWYVISPQGDAVKK